MCWLALCQNEIVRELFFLQGLNLKVQISFADAAEFLSASVSLSLQWYSILLLCAHEGTFFNLQGMGVDHVVAPVSLKREFLASCSHTASSILGCSLSSSLCPGYASNLVRI
jgi:hypothetical protein